PFFHSLLVALCYQHTVDGKMRSDLTQHLNVVQIQQPVCIIDHQCFPFREINKTTHLFLKTVTVMLDLLRRHHRTHIRSSRRIADVTGSASDQCDRPVSSFLETLHQAQRHEMSHMKTVCSWVKPDIESCFSVVDQFTDLFLIRNLGNQPSCL